MSTFRAQAARIEPAAASPQQHVHLPTDPNAAGSRLPLLRRLPTRQRIFALTAALRHCSDAESEVFSAELLELLAKNRKEAVLPAASVFCRLSPQAQSAAVCVAGEALIASALALLPDEPLAKRSIAALAAVTQAPNLAARLPEMLVDADPAVAAAAERAFQQIASAAPSAATVASDSSCEMALLNAIAGFDRHRRKGILIAGLRLLGTPTGLARATACQSPWLADATHPAQLAIRSLLRRHDEPGIAAAALVWLRVGSQASACRERLLAAGHPDEHDAVIRLAHLMTHPARVRAMRLEVSGRHPLPTGAWQVDLPAYASLSDEARRQTPRWISSLPLTSSEAGDQLAKLGGDASPIVRLAMQVHSDHLPDGELIDLAYDDDDGVARAAALRLHRRAGRPEVAVNGHAFPTLPNEVSVTIERLARSPHASVRAICHAGRRPSDHTPEARTLWRLALRRDRATGLASLRDQIRMGPLSSRTAWISTIRALGVANDLERDICELIEEFLPRHAAEAGSANAMLAATLTIALGDCTGKRSAAMLNQALRCVDPRVGANAVEAMARRAVALGSAEGGKNLVAQLIELKYADAHRLRANSGMALLDIAGGDAADDARVLVFSMLADDRREHRLAGVWLSERAAARDAIRASQLIEPVRRLIADPDVSVRDRAARCARRLGVLADQELES